MSTGRQRTWARLLGLPLLALVFAQPACFTASVWQDYGARRHVCKEAAQDMADVYRLRDDDDALALGWSDRLGPLASPYVVPDKTTWLLLRPEQVERAIALRLDATLRGEQNLDFTIREDEAGRCTWFLGRSASNESLIPLAVTALSTEPEHRDQHGRHLLIRIDKEVDDGADHRLLARILWTPVALAGDVACLPLFVLAFPFFIPSLFE